MIIDFWNISQGAPHTIHLHGLDVDQQNDGVPHLSFEVHHMEHGFYHFKAPHAGTYLYHCHVVSSIHVQAGMYGLFVVKPSNGSNQTWDGGYEIQSEARIFMSEIDTNWHLDSVLLHEYDTATSHHMVPIPVYNPQHFLINGLSEQQLVDKVRIIGQANSNIYLRLANIGFTANRVIFPSGMKARTIDSDGRPLPSEEITDTVEVYPGERYGVLCNPSTEMQGALHIQYVNMNTRIIENEQEVEIDISGFWGVADQPSSDLGLFPNPVSDELVISDPFGRLNAAKDIVITSLNGMIVKRVKWQAFASQTIQVSDLPPGFYILSAITLAATHQHRFVKL